MVYRFQSIQYFIFCLLYRTIWLSTFVNDNNKTERDEIEIEIWISKFQMMFQPKTWTSMCRQTTGKLVTRKYCLQIFCFDSDLVNLNHTWSTSLLCCGRKANQYRSGHRHCRIFWVEIRLWDYNLTMIELKKHLVSQSQECKRTSYLSRGNKIVPSMQPT